MKKPIHETPPEGCGGARGRTMHGVGSGRAAAQDPRGRLTFLMCALMAFVFALPFAVPAAENDTVRVGYYENEVFQEGAREGAIKTGYAYEYYRKLSEYTGWKYKYVYGNYPELYQMLLDGKIDLLAGLAMKPERRAVIGYPQAPMGSESYNLVKHADDESITADPKTLEGKTIGVLDSALSTALQKYLAANRVTAKVRHYKEYTALFAAFDSGKLDVLAAESNGAAGRGNTEIITPFGGSSYFLCVNIRRPDLLDQLNRAQMTMQIEAPSFFHSLHMKYYPKTILARALSPAEKHWLGAHRTLRVGFLEDYMPYSGKDSNGRVTGVVKDIIPEIFKKLGISQKVSYTGYENYDVMIADLAADRIDVAFPVGGGLYFAEESGLCQSDPVTTMSAELVHTGDYSEEKTAHFAVNARNRMQYYFIRNNFPKSKMTMYPSIDACLEAVIAGKVGCTTLNGLRANGILKNSKYRKLSLHHLARNDERCFGTAIGNKNLLKILNRGLDMLGSGYAQKISHRYTYALYSYRLKDVLLDYQGVFASLLFAVGAVIIILLIRDVRRTRFQMAEKEIVRAHLEETNRGLVDRNQIIEKQRQQETELREQLEKKQNELTDALRLAQSASRAKTTFLSNMSHDIRTPMNAIVGFTELAASSIHDPKRVQEYLATIEQSSEHLLSLINDVLDMSRIESGKMTLNEAEVSLADVVHALCEIIQPSVREKELKFSIAAAEIRNERVICDKLRLNQVLLNLLSNAVKYTQKGGTISLRVEQKPSRNADRAAFEFRVRDNGMGMSEEYVKTIFEPFTREDDSPVSGIQGTGLGMAITQNIVALMGGRISVASQKGVGSEFVVSLEFRIAGGNAAEPAELKGRRALVVDDDAEACRNIAEMLRDFGMRGEECASGREAVGRAAEAVRGGDGFKVCVVSRRLPDMDGIETVRDIREAAGKDTAILLLTAYGQDDIGKAAEEAGAAGSISPPIFPSDLRKALVKSSGEAGPGRDDRTEADFPLKGKKVLLVDDSKLNLKIGILLLQGKGMIVDTAPNGQIAVDMIKEKGIDAYDFILMDVQMPVMDGYQATDILRKLPDGGKLKIIAFSANAFEEDKERSLKAGMDGHITKPLKIDALVKELTRISANA